MNQQKKLTWGQVAVLVAAALPMAAAGVAGGVASYFNFTQVLHSASNALSLVVAGEGVVLICAIVALAVTLMGQSTPGVVRLGMWLMPAVAAVAGGIIAPDLNTRVVMILSPLGMTAAGEGLTLVARRIVAFRTGIDLEAQRRAGLLVWHANRSQTGGRLARRSSRAAVYRLTKSFAATDAQMAVQVDDIQRFRIGENLDSNLVSALTAPVEPGKEPVCPAVAPAEPVKAIAPAPVPEPLTCPPVSEPLTPQAAPGGGMGTDGFEWIQEVMSEAVETVKADPLVKLLTVNEVADLKGVAPGTVRSWKSRGKLRVHDVVDGSPRFHPEDVAALD